MKESPLRPVLARLPNARTPSARLPRLRRRLLCRAPASRTAALPLPLPLTLAPAHAARRQVVLHGGTPRMARRPSLKGDLDVKSVFTAKLPSSPPGFARQIYAEMSEQWKGSPLPTEPCSFLLASFQLWKLGDPKCKTTEGVLSSWHRWQHKFE